MRKDFKPSFLSRAVAAVAPVAGMKRMAAERVLHQYRYEGAEMSHKRGSAPHNMSPNSFDVQRDRLQLMREAEDLERNFAPAMMLNRKYSMYVAPISYHAQTGDHTLDADIESYLAEDAFANCDHTGRYDFYAMASFAVMGVNRGGDYGFAFTRPGIEEGMAESDIIKLPLKTQAVEPDRIGGVYQNVVSNSYVSGLNIGPLGDVESYRVFHRSMTTNVYDNPIDIPAKDFVHILDPLRIDTYRGVSKLATAVQNLRDLYEMIDFVKGKAKIASALTVFTNSNGATIGNGAMDAYSGTLTPPGVGLLQQDIQFGQINHLAGGTDIKFPQSNSPSSEEQALMQLLLELVCMAYNLPYSFGLNASKLGGVSARLESELAKAEFERGQTIYQRHFTRIKNTFLLDAIAKGVFDAKLANRITRGRWGYRAHPQPDLGKEASAAVNLNQNGLLNPIKHWIDNAEDPETVASDMVRWHKIKREKCAAEGFDIKDVFGSGMAMPLSSSESVTQSATIEPTGKQFGRNDDVSAATKSLTDLESELADIRAETLRLTDAGDEWSQKHVQENRVKIDQLTERIKRLQDWISKNSTAPAKPEAAMTEEERTVARAVAAVDRYDRHALTQALLEEGRGPRQAAAIACDIVGSGKFDKSRLPSDIQKEYYP